MLNRLFQILAAAALWSTLCLASTLGIKRGATPLTANMTSLPAQFFPSESSQRVKIAYGPYASVPMTSNNGMSTYNLPNAEVPCTDCLVTWMRAELEYPNGTVANADTNLWLHHVVFFNMGRNSSVCPGQVGEQFFASGNERTPIDICVNGTDQAGYYIAPGDTFDYSIELMNMEMTPQEAILTVTWEFIPSVPANFSKVRAIWLDIGSCTGGSDKPAISTGAFSYTSIPWVSNISGRITFMGAHLHDGGTHLEIKRNSTVDCDCEAAYGQDPAYIGGVMSMGTTSMSSMSMSMSARDAMPMSSMSMSMSSMSMPMSTTSLNGATKRQHPTPTPKCTSPQSPPAATAPLSPQATAGPSQPPTTAPPTP